MSKSIIFILISIALLIQFIISCAGGGSTRRQLAERHLNRREYLKIDRTGLTRNPVITGYASYYGADFHGKKTASGEPFDMQALTAAHRTLPFGTICKVTNLKNNRSVLVRINDRGPFVKDRILDLSRGAAKAIGALKSGVIPVRIEIVSLPDKN